MSIKKKRMTEDHDSPDRWVISYADFITLLFAFFTAMYAISHVDAGKLEIFTGSMRSAFKSTDTDTQKPIIDGIKPVSPDVIAIEREFRAVIETLKIDEGIDVRRDERGLVVSMGDAVLFYTGEAAIKDKAVDALTAIVSILQKIPNNIIIEGHTDNVQMNPGARYPSNWELSTARATSILNYIIKNHNISPHRLSASGYAEFKPVSPNSTPDGRAKNRRVDIIIMDKRS